MLWYYTVNLCCQAEHSGLFIKLKKWIKYKSQFRTGHGHENGRNLHTDRTVPANFTQNILKKYTAQNGSMQKKII